MENCSFLPLIATVKVASSLFMTPPSKAELDLPVFGLKGGRLHPGWRRPRAGPESYVGLHRLCRLDVRDELLLVARDGEAGHRGVVGRLVTGVATHGVVTGPHRDAPPCE